MALKNIVFDFDGVIADSADIIFALFREIHPATTHRDFMAHHDGNVYEEPVVKFSPEVAEQFYADYSNRLSVSHISEAIDPIKRLASIYRLFIVSSNTEPGVHAVLTEAGIKHLFLAAYGYETHKSKNIKFEMLRDNFQVKFDETVFITDTVGDIKEGNKVGVKVIAETFGFHPRERLEQEESYAVVDSWDEIEEKIRNLAAE